MGTGTARGIAAALAMLLAACAPTAPTPTPPETVAPTPSPTPEVLRGELRVAVDADRHVPADGRSSTTLVARLTDGSGTPVADRQLELRPTSAAAAAGAAVSPASRRTDARGAAEFEVIANQPGTRRFELFGGTPDDPLAAADVEFTRKVVVLAPGFQSALARRFLIFGAPTECPDPARPASISEALICLGYTPNAVDDPLVVTPTPGATIVDMSWEPAPCRPSDDPQAEAACVATVSSADGDVVWQPPAYDLADLAVSLVRQSSVDAWAERLARTLVAYDEQLEESTGSHASFYLVGHSLGGEVVVRMLRAIVDEPDLAGAFGGDERGRLQLVLSVDGALNWTGGFELDFGGGRCGVPVRTIADPVREADNVDAVERAFDELGAQTVAVTSETDPVVGPDVALLRTPEQPERGYTESVFVTGGECGHTDLLWPEPSEPVTYPLNDLFVEHIGPAAGG